jgi:hypothetical protein
LGGLGWSEKCKKRIESAIVMFWADRMEEERKPREYQWRTKFLEGVEVFDQGPEEYESDEDDGFGNEDDDEEE